MDKNGIAQLNAYETDFVFHEIFEKNVYLRNGIRLDDNAVVIDVGANIGLFSLFIKTRCPSARIHAFEPVPDAYRCLVENGAAFRDTFRANNVAVSNRTGSAELTYYPGYSVISGLHANRDIDSCVIEAGMRGANVMGDAEIHETVSGRFRVVTRLTVRTETLSEIIAHRRLEKISLLKIDAERSEIPIVEGIDAGDWARIEQIVIEYHSTETRQLLERLLTSRAFRVTAVDDDRLGACGIGTLYATRSNE